MLFTEAFGYMLQAFGDEWTLHFNADHYSPDAVI